MGVGGGVGIKGSGFRTINDSEAKDDKISNGDATRLHGEQHMALKEEIRRTGSMIACRVVIPPETFNHNMAIASPLLEEL